MLHVMNRKYFLMCIMISSRLSGGGITEGLRCVFESRFFRGRLNFVFFMMEIGDFGKL